MKHGLIRIRHEEVLASVAGSPGAITFSRTSYCVAPSSLRDLPAAEMSSRVATLLEAGYAKRNRAVAKTEDPTPMLLLGFTWEWVPTAELASRPWTEAFQPFEISDDGATWRLVPWSEFEALFDQKLSNKT